MLEEMRTPAGGRMGGNTNVEEVMSSSQGGRGTGRRGCFRQGSYAEKIKREEADLIVSDQLLVAKLLPHCVVIVRALICLPW